MLSVAAAQEQILAGIVPLPSEIVALLAAQQRVLATTITAPLDLPPFANSAMDGYAVRAADLAGATTDQPIALRMIGEVPAGGVYTGILQPGTTIRIFTGAPLPDGADAVLQQELTTAGSRPDEVLMQAAVTPGQSVRASGSDISRGTVLLAPGVTLCAPEIAAIAACGIAEVAVTRQPRVAIVATGDELVALGQPLGPGQIYNSNTALLAAAVREAGGIPVVLLPARDTAADIRARFTEAAQYNLVLSSGGVSVGEYDLVKTILAEMGAMSFWRVNMRPGKPLAFGRLGATPFLGLPGNPVSSAVTCELFARPLIRAMLGCQAFYRTQIAARLGEGIPRGDREHYVRARLEYRTGVITVLPTGDQGSHRLASLLGADALAIIPAGSGEMANGEIVTALLLR